MVRYSADGFEVEPGLATWEVSDDGLRYTFTLRDHVFFHDGQPLNSDAVIDNFKRWSDKNDPQYAKFERYHAFMADIIQDVRKIDDRSFEIILKEPNAPFLQNLAMTQFSIVSPSALKQYGEDIGRHPVGTGPFRFEQWKAEDSITLVKNEAYWGEVPILDKLVYKVIKENSARLNALMAGDVDLIDGVLPSDIARIEADGRFQIYYRSPNNFSYLGFHTQKPPFDNPLVRRAVAHAIDKAGLIKAFFEGAAIPAASPLPPAAFAHDDGLQDYPYDLERAKNLLKEAGYPDGIPETLTFYAMPIYRPYMPNGQKVAEAIQHDLEKIGIKTKIESPEWAVYLNDLKEGKAHMFLLGWTGSNGDPDVFLNPLLDKDNIGGSNRVFYDSEELHQLLKEGRRTMDPDRRREIYIRAQKLIHEEVPMVPIAYAEPVLAGVKSIQGFIPHPGGQDLFNTVSMVRP
ncbi:MAG: ABC transporter substrate-binding protein [Hydrogenibacillus sp.]|nr:ABC transporter substrate-binding protein [Hydrogenibacillus sp.]